MPREWWQRFLSVALLIVLALAALAPIRSYDFFWHLATGRWIVEHRALPLTDPFATASDRTPWINGEWFFEVVLYFLWRLFDYGGLSWLRAFFVAAIFWVAYFAARRQSDSHSATILLAAIAFAAGHARLDVRPLTAAVMLLVLALVLVRSTLTLAPWLYIALTIVWINTHPSALLAPMIAAAAQLPAPRKVWLPIASAAALLVNPYGWWGVVAPLELTRFATSGAFVNMEWLPSDARLFPLLYVAILAVAVVFATATDKRSHLWRIVVLGALAFLAVRHVRHQPFFLAALPILTAPAVHRRLETKGLVLVAAIAVSWTALSTRHTVGIDEARFPLRAVARLRESGLRGNFYNPDQFGGLLIWSFYPERRALTDGRNELYRRFLAEYETARADSRAWEALLRRYHVDLAVDEYRPPLQVVDAVTQRSRSMPASLAYFPRREWALIAYDSAGMVFARRVAFTRDAIAPWEVRGVIPDGLRQQR